MVMGGSDFKLGVDPINVRSIPESRHVQRTSRRSLSAKADITASFDKAEHSAFENTFEVSVLRFCDLASRQTLV